MLNTENPLIRTEQKQQFEKDGFFTTDVVFSDNELAPLRDEFERFWKQLRETASSQDANVQEQARYRPFMIRLHETSTVCADFCRHPVFLQLCRELLGPDADLSWNQAIIKPPAPIDNTFSWHQDMWYAMNGPYQEDCDLDMLQAPDTSFTMWVAVSRTIVDNGTLWVLPGMHQAGLLPHVKHDKQNEWVGQYDTSWKTPAVMRAGQALVFNKYLPHSSGPNISDETRMAYQISYSKPGLKKGASPDLMPVLRDGKPYSA